MKKSNLKLKIKNPENILLFLGLLIICLLSTHFIYQTLKLSQTQREIEENELPPKLDLQKLQKKLSLTSNNSALTKETSLATLEDEGKEKTRG